jgi:hypothetical protein
MDALRPFVRSDQGTRYLFPRIAAIGMLALHRPELVGAIGLSIIWSRPGRSPQ